MLFRKLSCVLESNTGSRVCPIPTLRKLYQPHPHPIPLVLNSVPISADSKIWTRLEKAVPIPAPFPHIATILVGTD